MVSRWTPKSATSSRLACSVYPEPVRERLGYRWTVADQLLLDTVGRATSLAWRFVPPPLRYHPRARAGWRRARGQIPMSEPLVETPALFLPPVDEREDPKHYVPVGWRPPSAAPGGLAR